MAKIKDYLHLLRVRQWYKNLVIFLAIFFTGEILNLSNLFLTVQGFFCLALISSSYYIINDIIDLSKDRLHPEKKLRPLASRKITLLSAILVVFALMAVGYFWAYTLGTLFFNSAIFLFIFAMLYSIILKDILFADTLTIAILFVIRSISGALLIKVWVSPWLILCPFFLSLFLSVGKRHADVLFLKKGAEKTRKVLKNYTPQLSNSIMTITTTLLIISYAFYSFLSEHQNLLYTLPFALFVIFRYYYLVNKGSIIARHPEKFIFEKELVIGILSWVIVTFLSIYY